MRLEGNRSEAGNKNIEIHLMDADGRPVVPPLKGVIPMPAPPVGLRIGHGIVVNYNNIKFPAYGSYSVSVVLNGYELVSLPLTVSPPPATS